MPAETFPRTRSLDLSAPEAAGLAPVSDETARADGANALVVDASLLPDAPPPPPPGSKPPPPAGQLHPLPRVAWVELSRARIGDEACLDEDENRAGGAVPVRCPSSPFALADALASASLSARRGDAVLLDGLDRWYRLGHAAAGYCPQCNRALNEAIQKSYGPQIESFSVLAVQRASGLPWRERPYAGVRESQRLEAPLQFAKAAILRARDEARAQRGGLELPVLARVGTLSALSLLLGRHLDGLVFALPSLEPLEALFPLLAARAALGDRQVVAQLPPAARPDQVRLFAALATACGCDLMLQPGASPESRAALASHRRYAAGLRERYRAPEPLSDIDLVVAPRAEHWSQGKHLRASALVAAALQRAQLQVGVALHSPRPRPAGARLIALCGATDLPDSLALPLRRHVEQGGDLLLVGPCQRIDDEGRQLGPLFPEVKDTKEALERVSEGRVYQLPVGPDGQLSASALEPLLLKALRELLGRSPRVLSMQGRGVLLARAYLDPERKLDVHLVNLDLREGQGFAAAQGVLLQIAGAAAGAGRTGYWFSPERPGKDGERIALNPSGFSVSTVLPSVGACALLSVPR
jgi:hypothetical protein